MRRIIATTLFAGLVIPVYGSALSINDIQQQISALLLQYAQIQQQIMALPPTPGGYSSGAYTGVDAGVGGGTGTYGGSNVSNFSSNTSCPVINYTLSRGSRGAAVIALQQFLGAHGFLSADSATGFYGPLTESAVRNFQAQQGISFSGVADTGWGVVGARTSAAIVQLCSAGATASVPSAPATPTTCPIAPPPTSACSTGWQALTDSYGCTTSYKCSTPLPGSGSGMCPAIGWVQPTSYCAGAWRATYSGGCQDGWQCADVSAVSDMLSALPTSGSAPLSVMFRAGVDWSSAYRVYFGDGTNSGLQNNCPGGTIGACGQPSVQHTFIYSGSYTVRLVSNGTTVGSVAVTAY